MQFLLATVKNPSFQPNFPPPRKSAARLAATALMVMTSWAGAQQAGSRSAAMPRVITPSNFQPAAAAITAARHRPLAPSARDSAATSPSLYPWRLNITATVFWIGELPTANNPVPNTKSSWDQNWVANFGGYDDPDPQKRVANHRNSDFRPINFVPQLNPFYVALPYNDVQSYNAHKPEAARVVPWFARMKPAPGKTTLKGRWIQIYRNGKTCYAQWEDCGPFVTDDWQYVFGGSAPKNHQNRAAGIDISPAIRDYMGLKSGQKCHWRFVEESQVPYGPWKRYGQQQQQTHTGAAPAADSGADFEAKRRYMEYLRQLRDAEYRAKGSSTHRR